MNIVLWIIQALLVIVFGMAGLMKVFQTQKARAMLPWAKDRSDAFVRFVGGSELLAAAGLLLPMITGILPWLTIWAAVGLVLLQLLAIFTEHLPKREYSVLPMNAILLGLALFTVAGRWVLMRF